MHVVATYGRDSACLFTCDDKPVKNDEWTCQDDVLCHILLDPIHVFYLLHPTTYQYPSSYPSIPAWSHDAWAGTAKMDNSQAIVILSRCFVVIAKCLIMYMTIYATIFVCFKKLIFIMTNIPLCSSSCQDGWPAWLGLKEFQHRLPRVTSPCRCTICASSSAIATMVGIFHK